MFKLTLNKEVTCYICIVHFGRTNSTPRIVYNSFINFFRHSFIKHSLHYAPPDKIRV
jgi:hypothetical protein